MTPRSRLREAGRVFGVVAVAVAALAGCGDSTQTQETPQDIIADVRNGRYAAERNLTLVGSFENCNAEESVSDTLDICTINFTGGPGTGVPTRIDCDLDWTEETGEFAMVCTLTAELEPCVFFYDIRIQGTITDTTIVYTTLGEQIGIQGPDNPCLVYVGECAWADSFSAVYVREPEFPCPPDGDSVFPLNVNEFLEGQVLRSFLSSR